MKIQMTFLGVIFLVFFTVSAQIDDSKVNSEYYRRPETKVSFIQEWCVPDSKNVIRNSKILNDISSYFQKIFSGVRFTTKIINLKNTVSKKECVSGNKVVVLNIKSIDLFLEEKKIPRFYEFFRKDFEVTKAYKDFESKMRGFFSEPLSPLRPEKVFVLARHDVYELGPDKLGRQTDELNIDYKKYIPYISKTKLEKVNVFVLDSAYSNKENDLLNIIDDANHGKPISILINSIANSNQVVIHPIKVCGKNSAKQISTGINPKALCYESDVIEALEKIKSNEDYSNAINIFNMSFASFYTSEKYLPQNYSDSISQLISINESTDGLPKNIFIASVGNITSALYQDFRKYHEKGGLYVFPARYFNVIGVGSYGNFNGTLKPSGLDVLGDHFNIYAPGRWIEIGSEKYSGSSFATAFVSGILAHIASRCYEKINQSEMDNENLVQRFLKSEDVCKTK